MDMMTEELELLGPEPIRKLKRVEFDQLAAAGCFANERVELLFVASRA